jgi:hypothetical protein
MAIEAFRELKIVAGMAATSTLRNGVDRGFASLVVRQMISSAQIHNASIVKLSPPLELNRTAKW